VKAMILAAGLGTRLRPLTLDRPKPLVDVHGRPLIEYNLLLLRRYGIVDVIINLHHQGDALRASLGSGDTFGVRIVYSPEDPLLDTGGAIKNAASLLGDDDFLVLNGDTIIDLPLDALLAAHRARRAAATLVLRHDPEQQRYGLVEIDGEERIRRFLGRPAEVETALEPYMFAGVHVLSSRVLDYMPDAGTTFSITRATYPAMLAADEGLYGFPFAGFWRVIDTAADLARANAILEERPPLHFL
jgi:NDP-sugar pyrophosphorylase family protein